MWGYAYGKWFGSKIAWTNRKEGDRVGVSPGTEHVVEGNDSPLRALYPDPPLPCHPPCYWLRLFLSQTISCMHTPTFLKPSHFTPTCPWRWNRQSVPKRRHIKFRHLGITQKKAYNNFVLGSGFAGGCKTVTYLWPVTIVFQLQVHWVEVQLYLVCMSWFHYKRWNFVLCCV